MEPVFEVNSSGIIAVKIGALRIPVSQADVSKISEIRKHIMALIELGVFQEPRASNLQKLAKSLTELQRKYIAVLNVDKWTSKEEIDRFLSLSDPRALAGIRAGITRKARKILGISETIDEEFWDKETSELKYRLKAQYADVKNYLK